MSIRAFVRGADHASPRAVHAQGIKSLLSSDLAVVRPCKPNTVPRSFASRQFATRCTMDPFVVEHVRTKPNEPLPVDRVLKLSPEEKELLNLLEQSVQDRNLHTTVRIAGGWVRDKLLNLAEKKDVDIAVDDMSGVKFARLFNKWSTKRHGKTFRTGVIATNPDKSKHLETANMLIGSFSVDFVNLRSEEYDKTSRVPKIKMAAAVEDAKRRDLTINSLFFNLRTKAIEDLTDQGLKDLCDGVIRTPLEPSATLLDDPLRLLRSVRFACRFNFRFDEELYKACFQDDVRLALRDKISAERMAVELQNMLSKPSSARAISALNHFRVLSTVLGVPEAQHIKPISDIAMMKCMQPLRHRPVFFKRDSSSISDQATESYLTYSEWWLQSHQALKSSPRCEQLQQVMRTLHADVSAGTDAATFGLSVLTFPTAAFEYHYLNNKRPIALSEYLIMTGMRRASNVAATVSTIHAIAIRIVDYLLRQDLPSLVASLDVSEGSVKGELAKQLPIEGLARADIGNVSAVVGSIQRVDLAMLALKSKGMFAAGLSCALTWLLTNEGAVKVNPMDSRPAVQVDDAEVLSDSVQIVDAEKYQQLVAASLSLYRAFKILDMENVHTLKPLISGAQLPKVLPNLRAGPGMGEILDLQLALQAARRSTTEAEMEQFLKNIYPEYCN